VRNVVTASKPSGGGSTHLARLDHRVKASIRGGIIVFLSLFAENPSVSRALLLDEVFLATATNSPPGLRLTCAAVPIKFKAP
jgi:hypothetical protein